MYHLFESEMKSISSFNAMALGCFSVSSLLLQIVIAIVIGWGFSTGQLSEFGDLMIHKGVYFVGVLCLLFFIMGISCIRYRKTITDQIKRETVSGKAVTRPPQ